MRVTQWGEYGVHCCVMLAQRDRAGTPLTNANDIAEAQMIDPLYAQQILQRLRKASLIESVRGPQGGYKLSRPAAEITLQDILVAAEGDTFEVICDTKPIDHERCCSSTVCNLRSVWHDLKAHVDSFLKTKTLEELAFAKHPTQEEDAPVQIGLSR